MPLVNQETDKSVKELIDSLEESKKADANKLLKIMEEITGKKAKIWGNNKLIGFGKYKYKRKGSKEELEWFNVGFAPRKDKITIYVTYYLNEDPLLEKLGKHKCGKGCLYIKKLEDINIEILKKIIAKSKSSQWGCY